MAKRKEQSSQGSFTGTLNNAAKLYAKDHSTNLLEQADALDRSIARITRRMIIAAKAGKAHQVVVLSDLLARQKRLRLEVADQYASLEVKPVIRDRSRWEETDGQAKVHASLKAPRQSTSTTRIKALRAVRNAGIKLLKDE